MEGLGTIGSPFLLSTFDDLLLINNNLAAYYKLVNDIDCTPSQSLNNGAGWVAIGKPTATKFTGDFNGNGHILYNLYINRPTQNDNGFFWHLNYNSKVYKLGFKNAYVKSNLWGGILAAYANGQVWECFVEGDVEAGTDATLYLGGFAGESKGVGTDIAPIYDLFKNCYANITIKNAGANSSNDYGGIIPLQPGNDILRNCYVNITYSSGVVTIHQSALCFYIYTMARIINCYYNSTLYPAVTTWESGTPLTDTQMKTKSSFVNYDFENIWLYRQNDYPTLRAFYDLQERNNFDLTLDTTGPEIFIDLPTTAKKSQNIDILVSASETTTFAEFYFIDSKNIRHDISLNKIDNLTYTGVVNFLIYPSGYAEFFAVLENDVGNVSTVTKKIFITFEGGFDCFVSLQPRGAQVEDINRKVNINSIKSFVYLEDQK